MGLWISQMWNSLAELARGNENVRVLMVGLDNAGKTTVLYKVKLNEAVCTIPTIGFNVESVQPVKGLTMTVWDVGGQKRIRELWHHYFHGTKGLIYVIDSTDAERMAEAKEELFEVINADEMRDVPTVIFANKQDLPHALTPAQVAEKVGLTTVKGRPWTIQGTCATTGDGICEGFQQLVDMIKRQRKEGRL